jgi:hypothetical protein
MKSKTGIWVWIVSIMAAGVAVSAQAETYQLQLRVDAEKPTCAEQKPLVESAVVAAGESLGKDLKNVRVSCLQEFSMPKGSDPAHRSYLVSVRYEVTGFPTVYTAHWGSDSVGRGSGLERGLYAKVEDCLSAQEGEVDAFELNTGLKAAFVGCAPQQVGDLGAGFVLSITGFGKPKASLQVLHLSATYWDRAELDQDELRWVKGYLYSKGARIRLASGSRIAYFAPSQIDVSMRAFGHWNDEQHCRRQLSDAAMILAGTPFYFSCKSTELDVGIIWVQLQAIYAGSQLYMSDFGHLSPHYESFDACRAFLPEVVQDAKASDPVSFLGALCVPESSVSTRWVIEKWSRL